VARWRSHLSGSLAATPEDCEARKLGNTASCRSVASTNKRAGIWSRGRLRGGGGCRRCTECLTLYPYNVMGRESGRVAKYHLFREVFTPSARAYPLLAREGTSRLACPCPASRMALLWEGEPARFGLTGLSCRMHLGWMGEACRVSSSSPFLLPPPLSFSAASGEMQRASKPPGQRRLR
jgi:hypothetical protein